MEKFVPGLGKWKINYFYLDTMGHFHSSPRIHWNSTFPTFLCDFWCFKRIFQHWNKKKSIQFSWKVPVIIAGQTNPRERLNTTSTKRQLVCGSICRFQCKFSIDYVYFQKKIIFPFLDKQRNRALLCSIQILGLKQIKLHLRSTAYLGCHL